MYYASQRSHEHPHRVKLEIFNEWMILVISYHLFMFSEFNLSIEGKFYAGFSYNVCLLIVVFINLAIALIKMVSNMIRVRELVWLQRQYTKYLLNREGRKVLNVMKE